MFSVRIDLDGDGYAFHVEPFESANEQEELIAIDSTPGIIALVRANSPGEACERAWKKGEEEAESLHDLDPLGFFNPPVKIGMNPAEHTCQSGRHWCVACAAIFQRWNAAVE